MLEFLLFGAGFGLASFGLLTVGVQMGWIPAALAAQIKPILLDEMQAIVEAAIARKAPVVTQLVNDQVKAAVDTHLVAHTKEISDMIAKHIATQTVEYTLVQPVVEPLKAKMTPADILKGRHK